MRPLREAIFKGVSKVIRLALFLLYFVPWLVQKTRAACKPNTVLSVQNLNLMVICGHSLEAGQFPCFYFEFWLAQCDAFIWSYWLLKLLLLRFSETQSKNALMRFHWIFAQRWHAPQRIVFLENFYVFAFLSLKAIKRRRERLGL